MDPLYANYDKRKKTLDENSAPVPQPTPNSMPVFGAAAAPVVNQAPVAEPASVAEPTPAPAPAVEPVAEPAPVATPVAELDPTIESTPVQDPFAPKPQSNDFQQEFEQLVDGTKPAQLSEPQPQFNPNYTGTGDIVLNLDQPKKKFNTKIIAIIAGIVVITILAVVLIAMGGGKKGGAGNNKQDVTSFIEYFIFGTEGENEVTDEILNGDPENFAFIYNTQDVDYNTKLIDKISNNEELKKQIEAYFEITKILDMNYMLIKYIDGDSIEESGYGLPSVELAVKEYERNTFEYYKVLDDNGCINDGKKDIECAREYSDETSDALSNSEKQHAAIRKQRETIIAEIVEKVKGLRR